MPAFQVGTAHRVVRIGLPAGMGWQPLRAFPRTLAPGPRVEDAGRFVLPSCRPWGFPLTKTESTSSTLFFAILAILAAQLSCGTPSERDATGPLVRRTSSAVVTPTYPLSPSTNG